MTGGAYEKETKTTSEGERISCMQTSFCGGMGLVISVRNETNSKTNESKTSAELDFGLSIGLGINLKFEIFIPFITEKNKPNK